MKSMDKMRGMGKYRLKTIFLKGRPYSCDELFAQTLFIT